MKIENDQYKGIEPLFDICERKHGGNPMSVAANKIASKGKVGARQQILSLFSLRCIHTDWTCEEIEYELNLSHQSCSARLSELRREGKIKVVGERKTRSGTLAAVLSNQWMNKLNE